MKRTVSQHGPRLSLLCVALLLCVGNAGSMDPEHLRQIVKYITGERPRLIVFFYADGNVGKVAVNFETVFQMKTIFKSMAYKIVYMLWLRGWMTNIAKTLRLRTCKLPCLRALWNRWALLISKRNGLYNPTPIGNIVAARPLWGKKGEDADHAEWRLLYGDQNHPSPVARILENKDPNSCLIFFVSYSPCSGKCLTENLAGSIVDLVRTRFESIHQGSKAFVFENVYTKGNVEATVLVDAWKRIQNVPLFRCRKNEACINCFENIPQNERNPCLDPPAPVPIG